MTRPVRRRKRLAVLAVLALVLSSGCLAGGRGGLDGSATPTTATPDTGTPTATPLGGTFEPANGSDPDHAVRLDNARGEWVTVDLRVDRRGTNETVHAATHEVAPGDGPWAVYDLPAAAGDAFVVTATVGTASARVVYDTARCHGGVHVHVRADDLRVFADRCDPPPTAAQTSKTT